MEVQPQSILAIVDLAYLAKQLQIAKQAGHINEIMSYMESWFVSN